MDLIGLKKPEDEILEEPEEHLPMDVRERATGDRGGKSLSSWQRQRQKNGNECDERPTSFAENALSLCEALLCYLRELDKAR